MRIVVPSPAKINTFLSVGPAMADGYHPIRSIFEAIDWCDTLTLQTSTENTLTCNWAELPASNTLTRTLAFVRELYALPPLHIHLEKSIPDKSGLGGGSSNAAALIRGIAALLQLEVGPFFFDVAQSVGADVPFFLVGGRARVSGKGEVIEPLGNSLKRVVLVYKPPVSMSTAEAYSQLDAKSYAWREFPEDLDTCYNDFERVADCLCLEAIEQLQKLGATSSGLSGSGSAVFGFFDEESTASKALPQLEALLGGSGRVCHTLNRSESLRLEMSP